MEAVKNIEKQLEGLFKGLPKFSDSTKESIAGFLPILAIISGALQLLAAYFLWHLTRVASALVDFANSLAVSLGYYKVGPSSSEKMVIYVGLILLVVEAVIMLMAFSPLQKRARRGWDLLFLSALVNVAYSVVQIFTYERGLGSFVLNLLGSAVGFYILFQVKDKFTKKEA